MANVIDFCEYRATYQRRKRVQHEMALTARALEVAAPRCQGESEVLDRGFDDDEASNLAGYHSRRSVYDGE